MNSNPERERIDAVAALRTFVQSLGLTTDKHEELMEHIDASHNAQCKAIEASRATQAPAGALTEEEVLRKIEVGGDGIGFALWKIINAAKQAAAQLEANSDGLECECSDDCTCIKCFNDAIQGNVEDALNDYRALTAAMAKKAQG